jgi:hypothetical protein
MKLTMRHMILAAAATLVAGFAATADAATTHRTGVRHVPQATYLVPIDVTAAPIVDGNLAQADHCFYANYNPNTSLGQGSGGSLTLGRLVCD